MNSPSLLHSFFHFFPLYLKLLTQRELSRFPSIKVQSNDTSDAINAPVPLCAHDQPTCWRNIC